MTYVTTYPKTRASRQSATWTPASSIEEHNEGYTISLDVPGLTREEIKVQVHEGILSISGERKRPENEGADNFRYNERPYGSFERSYRLPEYIDSEHIAGAYENGVLTLELKKKEEAKPRVIAVK